MTARAAALIRRQDGALVEVVLQDGLVSTDLLLIDRSWIPSRSQIHQELLSASVPRATWPQSLHWDWSRKAAELRLLHVSATGLVLDGAWQGAMLTKTARSVARLPEDKGKPIVYVEFLETAPWNLNLPAIGSRGVYKGVGAVLMREAVLQSLNEGFHGRVGLHSLPQSEEFYEKHCGMTAIARDEEKQGLVYFEFSRDAAQRFIERGAAQ